jgi:hypothetical protein
MSSPPVAPSPGRPRKKGKEKKSLLQMDLSSFGRRSSAADDEVEHEPFEPALPHVNLLPASIRQAESLRRVRRVLIVVGIVIALAAGGLWYVQGNQIAEAEASLASAQAENRELEAKVAALAPVKTFYTQLTAQGGLVDTAMASQPRVAEIVGRLDQAAAAAGIKEITDINLDFGGIPAPGADTLNACETPDPFGTDITMGCMTFNATAADRDQVAALLRLLEADSVFVGPYVNSTTFGTDPAKPDLAFSGSVGVSLDGLETPLTEDQVAAITAPPAPTPTPTAGGK